MNQPEDWTWAVYRARHEKPINWDGRWLYYWDEDDMRASPYDPWRTGDALAGYRYYADKNDTTMVLWRQKLRAEKVALAKAARHRRKDWNAFIDQFRPKHRPRELGEEEWTPESTYAEVMLTKAEG